MFVRIRAVYVYEKRCTSSITKYRINRWSTVDVYVSVINASLVWLEPFLKCTHMCFYIG